MATMHEVDYKIYGDDMQYVEVELDPMEAAVAEAGGMMYMDDGIEMETIFGDGSQQNSGFLGALVGAGKRLLTGESLFMTVFQNRGAGKKRVAFGAPYPGKIIPVHLAEIGGELIAQKDAFLCAAKGVSVGIAFNKKIGAGLFGGEGFIMERLQGDGWAFLHAGGTIYQRDLGPGEMLRVDTGCIVAFQPQVDFDIQFVGKIKSALFGGEGLFFATLRGPGRIWLQSLPFSRMASSSSASSSSKRSHPIEDDDERTWKASFRFLPALGPWPIPNSPLRNSVAAGILPVAFGNRFALSAQPRFLSLSSSKKEERAGERRCFLSIAPRSERKWRLACRRAAHPARRIRLGMREFAADLARWVRAARCRPLRQPGWLPLRLEPLPGDTAGCVPPRSLLLSRPGERIFWHPHDGDSRLLPGCLLYPDGRQTVRFGND